MWKWPGKVMELFFCKSVGTLNIREHMDMEIKSNLRNFDQYFGGLEIWFSMDSWKTGSTESLGPLPRCLASSDTIWESKIYWTFFKNAGNVTATRPLANASINWPGRVLWQNHSPRLASVKFTITFWKMTPLSSFCRRKKTIFRPFFDMTSSF